MTNERILVLDDVDKIRFTMEVLNEAFPGKVDFSAQWDAHTQHDVLGGKYGVIVVDPFNVMGASRDHPQGTRPLYAGFLGHLKEHAQVVLTCVDYYAKRYGVDTAVSDFYNPKPCQTDGLVAQVRQCLQGDK